MPSNDPEDWGTVPANIHLTLNIGDLVTLKSGGPTMTVARVPAGNIFCLWFDTNNRLQDGYFDVRTLNRARSRSPL